jgi:hypothetical protein
MQCYNLLIRPICIYNDRRRELTCIFLSKMDKNLPELHKLKKQDQAKYVLGCVVALCCGLKTNHTGVQIIVQA